MTPLLLILFISGLISGCAPGGGSSSAIPATEVEAVLPALPKSGDRFLMPTGTDPVDVIYYTHTKTVTPNKNWVTKTYTATASCLNYNSYVFCWDDGLKPVVISGYTYTYTYFGFQINPSNNAQVQPCNGGCVNDFFSQARIVTRETQDSMTANPELGKASTVFSKGTPKSVTCQLQGSLLNCVDFQIDLTQPLY